MFDEQGVWHDDTYNQPGGGAAAGLDVGNAVQTYQNYRRAREASVLGTILKLRAEPDIAESAANTPEGAQALNQLDVSPESVHQMYQTAPSTVFRQQVDQNPDWEPEDVERAGLVTGATNANQYGSAINRTLGTRVRQQRADTQDTKEGTEALEKAFKTNLQYTDSPQEAAAQAVSQVRVTHPNLQGRVLDDFIASYGDQAGGVQGAKEETLKATTALAKTRGYAIMQTLEPRINALNAETSYRKAMKANADARTDHLSQALILTPKQMADIAAKDEALANQLDANANKAFDDKEAGLGHKRAQELRTEAADWRRRTNDAANAPKRTPAPAAAGAAQPVGRAPGIPDGPWHAPDGNDYTVKGGLAYKP